MCSASHGFVSVSVRKSLSVLIRLAILIFAMHQSGCTSRVLDHPMASWTGPKHTARTDALTELNGQARWLVWLLTGASVQLSCPLLFSALRFRCSGWMHRDLSRDTRSGRLGGDCETRRYARRQTETGTVSLLTPCLDSLPVSSECVSVPKQQVLHGSRT